MTTHYVVAVYELEREYGGPEEGGWYYSDGPLVEIAYVSQIEDAANAEARRLNDAFVEEAGQDPDRLVATVVALPRKENEFQREACHLEPDQVEAGREVTRWDIPTEYRDGYVPHYC